MDRCHLKGSEGDALHAVLCAAGYNIGWLLRMIVKKGLSHLLSLLQVSGLTGLFEKLVEIFGLNRLQTQINTRRWLEMNFAGTITWLEKLFNRTVIESWIVWLT